MPQMPESSDLADWHRFFAAECNNRAWELSVRDRTGREDEELLNLAHASVLHWEAVGIRAYFAGRETDDWEIALVHVVHAHAAAAAGEAAIHAESYAAARAALDAIDDEEDRAIVMQTFSCVPGP